MKPRCLYHIKYRETPNQKSDRKGPTMLTFEGAKLYAEELMKAHNWYSYTIEVERIEETV